LQQTQHINNSLLNNLPNIIPVSSGQINIQSNLVQVPLNMQTKFTPILNSNQASSLVNVNIKPVQLAASVTSSSSSTTATKFDESDVSFNNNNKQQQHVVTIDSPMAQFRRPIPPTSPPQQQQQQQQNQNNLIDAVPIHSNMVQQQSTPASTIVSSSTPTSNPTNAQSNSQQQQQQQLEAANKIEKNFEQLEQQIGNVFQHAPPHASIINAPMVGVTSVGTVNAALPSTQTQTAHSQIINQTLQQQQSATTLNLNQQNLS
jgi:hypothetical protein